MKTQSTPTILRTLLAVLAVAILVFGGLGITGAAAQSAIPGDALYTVKTSIEQTRLGMAADAGDRAQLKLTFAEKRLDEIGRLIAEGRTGQIKAAVAEFEKNIQGAISELETVSKGDPARAALLAKEITAALTRYATTLSGLAAGAPDSVKEDVIRALDTTLVSAGMDDNSNDNANANSNDDNSNDDSANSNDDNSNDDSNSNDDNSNDDSANSNDDNSNDDSNSNDDNSNDDSSNTNDDNSNDDSANSNDDNSNDDSANSNDDNSNDDNSNSSSDDNSNDDNSNSSSDDNSNSSDDSGNSSGDDSSNSNDDSGKGGSDDNSNDNGSDD